MAHQVFVSYASEDAAAAQSACAALERAGLRCWIAPRDVPPGMHYGEAIVTAIRDSRLLVVVFSAHSNRSPQVLREAERAVSRDLPIIPLRIDATEPSGSMEYLLSSPHWLSASAQPDNAQLRQLVQAAQRIVTGAPAPAPAAARPSRRGTPADLLAAITLQVVAGLLALLPCIGVFEIAIEAADLGSPQRGSVLLLGLAAMGTGIAMLIGCVGLATRHSWGRSLSIAVALVNIPCAIVFGSQLGAILASLEGAEILLPQLRVLQLVQAVLSLALLVYLMHPRCARHFAGPRPA